MLNENLFQVHISVGYTIVDSEPTVALITHPGDGYFELSSITVETCLIIFYTSLTMAKKSQKKKFFFQNVWMNVVYEQHFVL